MQLPAGERIVRIAFAEASQEINLAINQTIANLFDATSNNEKLRSPSDLFKAFRYPNAPTRELARAAEIYERTLVNIRKHIDNGATVKTNMSDFHYKDILSQEHLNLVAELSGCMSHRIVPNCTNMCFHMKYRTIDGTCNNLQNPSWGASLTGFRRILKPIYENGFSTPIGWTKGKLYNGFAKPSARLVSINVISTKDITPDTVITHMVMQWGQFLDHDLDHAIPSVSSESWDGIDCKKSCEYSAPCYPIEVPENDPRIKNRRCIDLVRSSAICGSGMTSIFFGDVQPREQINQLTSYIDASQVYGYSETFARDLRNLSSSEGLLRTGVHFPGQKSMLPFSAPTDGIDCRRNVAESNVNCFTAGDIRVNEQIGLVAMHTIWLREHNRIASELHDLNPHWDGDTLYYEARKIVGAEVQHITYAHWLPNILGPEGMKILNKNSYTYDPSIDASVSNEFATAALRFGHTLINPILHRLNERFETIQQGHLPLHKAFFAPWRLVYEGGVDPLLRGMFTVPAKLKMPTQNLNTELTEKLFLTSHAVALDLAAINIQRARDHAIPSYNMYRKICNMTVAKTFHDLNGEISNADVRQKLKNLYGHPDNIDLFVGGVLEDQVEGGRVGPLFRCLLIEQFHRLRVGDRHWYESQSTFRPDQLNEIKMASLARVLCDNGDNITEINQNVFRLSDTKSGLIKCKKIPKMNLGFWLNCDKCSAHLDSTVSLIDPNLPRNRPQRSLRNKRNLSSFHDNSSFLLEIINEQQNGYQDENLIDINNERIDGLESLIDNFQETLKQLKKRIKKLEQTCSNAIQVPNEANEKDHSNKKFLKMNIKNNGHHCVDDTGTRRFNDEIWAMNDCTKCKCTNHQINCLTEKCQYPSCAGGMELVRINSTDCCAVCPVAH